MSSENNYLAVIPARGGSKRIPRKNVRSFDGKPIIAYSIQAALDSGCFSEVMVSTDDEEIAQVAIQYGATVPFMRSSQNSDDHSNISDVVMEVLDSYAQIGRAFEYFCCILPTAPFVKAERLKKGLDLILTTNADSVVPVTRFGYPIQRALRIDQDGSLKMFWPENYLKRSQDLEPSFHDVGQFYWMNSQALKVKKLMFTDNSQPLVIPESEVQDIDNEEDWKIAEIKYRMLLKD